MIHSDWHVDHPTKTIRYFGGPTTVVDAERSLARELEPLSIEEFYMHLLPFRDKLRVHFHRILDRLAQHSRAYRMLREQYESIVVRDTKLSGELAKLRRWEYEQRIKSQKLATKLDRRSYTAIVAIYDGPEYMDDEVPVYCAGVDHLGRGVKTRKTYLWKKGVKHIPEELFWDLARRGIFLARPDLKERR